MGRDAALQLFERKGDEDGGQGRQAEGPPPGAEVEGDRAQDREGEEHQEVDDLVGGIAQDAARDAGIGRESAEAQPGDGGEVDKEQEDLEDAVEQAHRYFLRFLCCRVWKSFSALILSMMVVTTS